MTEPDRDAAIVREAIAAIRLGKRDAYAGIVNLYQRRLFGLALMMTRDPAGAEDVVQDGLVRAFVHLDAYDANRPFYPWVSTIVVRLAQTWMVQRNRTRMREGTELDPDHDTAVGGPDPLAELIADERDRRLWDAVAALSSGERTSVILFYRQDMTVNDIASAIGVSAGTVKTMLFRGRQKLRKVLT